MSGIGHAWAWQIKPDHIFCIQNISAEIIYCSYFFTDIDRFQVQGYRFKGLQPMDTAYPIYQDPEYPTYPIGETVL